MAQGAGETFFGTFYVQVPVGAGHCGGDVRAFVPQNPSVCTLDKSLMQRILPDEFRTPYEREMVAAQQAEKRMWEIRMAEFEGFPPPEPEPVVLREHVLAAIPKDDWGYVCALNNSTVEVAPLSEGHMLLLEYNLIYTKPTPVVPDSAAAGTSTAKQNAKKRKADGVVKYDGWGSSYLSPSIDHALTLWNRDLALVLREALVESHILCFRLSETSLTFAELSASNDGLLTALMSCGVAAEIHVGVLSQVLTGDEYDDYDGHGDEDDMEQYGQHIVGGVETNYYDHRMMSAVNEEHYSYSLHAVMQKDVGGPNDGGYSRLAEEEMGSREVMFTDLDRFYSPIQRCMVPQNEHPFGGQAMRPETDMYHTRTGRLFDPDEYPGRIAKSTCKDSVVVYTYAPQVVIVVCRDRQ